MTAVAADAPRRRIPQSRMRPQECEDLLEVQAASHAREMESRDATHRAELAGRDKVIRILGLGLLYCFTIVAGLVGIKLHVIPGF